MQSKHNKAFNQFKKINMKKLKLTINGIHCASCGINLQKSISKVPGVKEVSVSVLTKKAFVQAEDNVKKEELEKAVARVGSYKILNIEEI